MRIFNRKRSKVSAEVEVPIEELIAELPEESRIFLRSWQCVHSETYMTDDTILKTVSEAVIDTYLRSLSDIGYIDENEEKRIRSFYKELRRVQEDETETAARAMRYMTNTWSRIKRTGKLWWPGDIIE